MHVRKDELRVGEYYHVMNKTIAGFKVFNADEDYCRMVEALKFYQRERPPLSFSRFVKMDSKSRLRSDSVAEWMQREKLVRIYAYCIMPTHLHLLLKQEKDNGISTFMSNVSNSYTRYFNTKLKRKGPLWEYRFKNVIVKTQEQLLHLTRYIHLNPVTAYLVEKSEIWTPSSYMEYVQPGAGDGGICEYKEILEMEPADYEQFVEDNISYQRELADIKRLTLE